MRELRIDPPSEAYTEEDRNVRLAASKLTYLVTFFFVLSGFTLDYFIYPEYFWKFLGARIVSSLILLAIFPIHFYPIGKRIVKVLPLFAGLLVSLTICWMIYQANGHVSPYYGGLNLVILGFAVLLPWTYIETSILWLGTLGFYLIACLANSRALSVEGTFFILLTGIACVISSHFSTRARFQDFLLRSELDERNRELQETNRVKTEFFSNVSHELRTPLTLIISPIEKVLHHTSNLPQNVHDTLLLVRQNSLRLLKLINDLLEATRVDEPDFKLETKALDLGSFVKELFESSRHLGLTKGITLTVDAPPEPLIIAGDVSRLEKIFLNLYTNAVKFTKEGGTISVAISQKGDQATVSVTDSGIGIAEEELPKIFDRFHQVDGSTTRTYQGVGIGLSLVKELVDKHEGSISVSSDLGKGSQFVVSFPLTDDVPQTNSQDATSTEETQPLRVETADTSNPIENAFKSADRSFVNYEEADKELPEVGSGEFTVLVVDDEPDMRRFIVNLMIPHYSVLQAADGKNGLKLAQERKPDLVLLDWMLPGINGLDICQELRKTDPNHEIKIIILTAKMEESSKIAALESGADDFLTKPFSTIEVETRVSNLLRTGALEDNLRDQNVELESAIDQLKEAEVQLVQSEKMSALGNLSAGLLHEVNNPLNFSITALQYVSQLTPKDNGEAHEAFDDINTGLDRIKNIVSDLHTFAYPEREESRTRFLIDEVIESGLRLVSHELTHIKVSQNIEEGCVVYGSKPQLIHVILNLLSNAAKAIEEAQRKKTGTISIDTRNQIDSIEIKVRDNGVGINKDDLSKIIEPFYTTREVGQGLGMGLSTCYTIVQNHHGTFEANSQEGEWTEIVITLPIKKSEEKDERKRELQKA